MKVVILVPWLSHKPGDVVDMGPEVHQKLVAKGKASFVDAEDEEPSGAEAPPAYEKAVTKPREKRNGRRKE